MEKLFLVAIASLLFFLSSSFAEPVSCDSCSSCSDAISKGNSIILSQEFSYDIEGGSCLLADNASDIVIDCNEAVIASDVDSTYLEISRSRNISIKNCRFNSTWSRELVAIRASERIKLEDSIIGIEGRADTSLVINRGLLKIRESKEVSIENNSILDYWEWGINIEASDGVMIVDNLLESINGLGGLLVNSFSKNTKIENNTIKGLDKGISLLSFFGDMTVIQNKFSQNTVSQIHIASPEIFGLSIKGNSFSCDTHKTTISLKPSYSYELSQYLTTLLDLSNNYWGTTNCTRVGGSLAGQTHLIIISPILSAPGGKEIQCPRNKRQTRPVFEYYSDSKMVIAGLRDDSGKLYVNAPLNFVVGKHTLSKKTDETGFVTINLADEPELLESIAGGNAKVIFLGNSLLLPSEARLMINDFTTAGKCFSLRKGSAHNKINFVFVVPYEGDFKEISTGYVPAKYTFFEKLKTGLIEKVIDPKGVSDGFGSIEPFKSNLEKFDFSLYFEWGDPQEVQSYPNYFTHLNKIEGCKADRIIILKPSKVRAYASTDIVSFPAGGYKKIDMAKRKGGHGVVSLGVIQTGNVFQPLFLDAGPVILHEAGHLFGLMDEYVEHGGPDDPGYPNCAPDNETAQSWWGQLIGRGAGDLEVVPGGVFGCSYVMDNIRANKNTVMNDHRVVSPKDWEHGFGPVNEWFLTEVFREYG